MFLYQAGKLERRCRGHRGDWKSNRNEESKMPKLSAMVQEGEKKGQKNNNTLKGQKTFY